MKILYAEDEMQLSMAVSEILLMEGYDVDVANDGEEALKLSQENVYDAAILDIMMPKMSGIDVLIEMRNKGDYTPCLLLTAKNQVSDRITGLSSGADDYLGKPFDMREFLARVNALVRRNENYRDHEITYGNVKLNCTTFELKTPLTSLQLTSGETDLLSFFIKKNNVFFSDKQLKDYIFPDAEDEGIVNLYLSYLSSKLAYTKADVAIEKGTEGYKLKMIWYELGILLFKNITI